VCQRDRGLSPFLGQPYGTVELMQPGHKREDPPPTERGRQLLGQGQRRVHLCQRLIRIAQQSQGQCHIGMTVHARVTAIQARVGPMPLGVVEPHALPQVRVGRHEIAQKVQRQSEGALCFQAQRRVARAVRQIKELYAQLVGLQELALNPCKPPQAHKYGKAMGVSPISWHSARARV
jgi:hypothetical protein